MSAMEKYMEGVLMSAQPSVASGTSSSAHCSTTSDTMASIVGRLYQYWFRSPFSGVRSRKRDRLGLSAAGAASEDMVSERVGLPSGEHEVGGVVGFVGAPVRRSWCGMGGWDEVGLETESGRRTLPRGKSNAVDGASTSSRRAG